jgi:hypothetical protein
MKITMGSEMPNYHQPEGDRPLVNHRLRKKIGEFLSEKPAPNA